MFGILFGWRKASKCKKLIKQTLCRLKMLKKKRDSIVKQSREDLFELINNGYQQIAFNRVEQLIGDERLIEAYDLIENFCEFILVKFSHIRKHKTCSDDINEAISSVIFASARCGDFPELKLVRKVFEEHYGQSFAMAAVELCPGNLVNPQIKEKLLMKHVSDHEKQRLISEIARDCFHPAILALEYCPDWHQKKVLENEDQTDGEGKEKPKVQDSNAEKLGREVISLDSSRDSGSGIVDPQCHSTSSSSFVCQSSPNGREEVCSNSALASPDLLSWKAKECNGGGWIAAPTLEDGLDRENDASSPEFLPFCEETIVDVVELPDPLTEYGDLWDQRFFKFKSPVTSMRENVRDGNDQSLKENHDDSNKKSISERSSQSIKASPKRLRRRSTCRERENNSSSHTKKKSMKCCCLSCHSMSSEMENYCLEQPCYVYSEYRTDDYEVVVSEKKKIGLYFIRSLADNCLDYDLSSKDSHHHRNHISWNGDSDEEIEFDTLSGTKKRRNYEIETVVYDVFVYSHSQADENEETNAKPEEFSTKGKHESSLGFNGMQNHFTKCMKAADKYPSHVHPKLPDFDEIATKFIALKREYLQRKQHQ